MILPAIVPATGPCPVCPLPQFTGRPQAAWLMAGGYPNPVAFARYSGVTGNIACHQNSEADAALPVWGHIWGHIGI